MPDEEIKGIGPTVGGKRPVEIIVSSKGLQVAKRLVQNMTGGADSDPEVDDSCSTELEARPPRLGLGAKFLPHSQMAGTLNPIERKLRAMTRTGKQLEGECVSNLRFPASSAMVKESNFEVESECEEDEVKGSSFAMYGRTQKRISPAELLVKNSVWKGRGSKRKR